MIAIFHLTRLNLGRIVRNRWVQFFGTLVPVSFATVARSDIHVPLLGIYTVTAAFAVAVVLIQAAFDRTSGFSDGIRTTLASDFAINTSRLAIIPAIIAIQLAIMAVAGRVFAFFG